MNKDSANILVFGWAIILLSLIGGVLLININLELSSKNALLLSGDCPIAKSFYQKSDLKNSEKNQFSSNAVAISAIGGSQTSYRIVFDYAITGELRDKVQVKVLVGSVGGGSLGGISISPLLNGTKEEKKSDPNSSGVDSTLYNSFELNSSSRNNTLGLLINKNDGCEFQLNNLINIDSKTVSRGVNKGFSGTDSAIKLTKSSQLELSPGSNYFGSLDWFDLKQLTSQGLKTSYFNSRTKTWVQEKQFGEPNLAYEIYNPLKDKIKVDVPSDYRVPDDINFPQVSQGWNFLYQGNSESISQMKLSFNPENRDFVSGDNPSIKDLVDKGFASNWAFRVQDGKLVKFDLNGSSPIDQGPFWLFINKAPDSILKQINLSLNVNGGGDTYQQGQFIPFKITIFNNDQLSHYLVSSAEVDPCQMKVVIVNDGGKTVFDGSGNQACPSWPNLEELSPGAKKEYNYTWQVPNHVTGNLTLYVYFDYSRLNGQKLLGEAKVLVK